MIRIFCPFPNPPPQISSDDRAFSLSILLLIRLSEGPQRCRPKQLISPPHTPVCPWQPSKSTALWILASAGPQQYRKPELSFKLVIQTLGQENSRVIGTCEQNERGQKRAGCLIFSFKRKSKCRKICFLVNKSLFIPCGSNSWCQF